MYNIILSYIVFIVEPKIFYLNVANVTVLALLLDKLLTSSHTIFIVRMYSRTKFFYLNVANVTVLALLLDKLLAISHTIFIVRM